MNEQRLRRLQQENAKLAREKSQEGVGDDVDEYMTTAPSGAVTEMSQNHSAARFAMMNH